MFVFVSLSRVHVNLNPQHEFWVAFYVHVYGIYLNEIGLILSVIWMKQFLHPMIQAQKMEHSHHRWPTEALFHRGIEGITSMKGSMH